MFRHSMGAIIRGLQGGYSSVFEILTIDGPFLLGFNKKVLVSAQACYCAANNEQFRKHYLNHRAGSLMMAPV